TLDGILRFALGSNPGLIPGAAYLGACAAMGPDDIKLFPVAMPAHILYVSYDDRILIARRTLLEGEGYLVSSALGFKEATAACGDGEFDLFILGHSIPYSDKERLIALFRSNSPAPILSLWRRDERVLDTVNYVAFSDDPGLLVKNIATI